jgi:hypothetical protein
MKTIIRAIMAFALAGLFVLVSSGPTQNDRVVAQGRKPVYIYRFYAGADGLTHVERQEATFSSHPELFADVYKMMAITGAELHRSKPGGANGEWHIGPQRQYIVNLAGHGEIEVAGGEKVELGPGDIELIEDTTGKGHITRTLGTEDRVSLWLPLADQSGKN